MIKKFSLENIPAPWNEVAIRAMLDFSDLAKKHERKAIRVLSKKAASEKRNLQRIIRKINEDSFEQFWGKL